MTWLAYLLLLFALSWVSVGAFRWYAIDKGLLDEPTARSSHIAPTPRGGGVVFFLGWVILFSVLYYFDYLTLYYVWLFSPILAVGLVGFWDDHKSLSAATRFLVQCLAAVACLFLAQEGGELVSAWLPIPIPLPICFLFLVVAMVWVTNLFNFMDGSDGFAACEGIFVFTVGGYLLYCANAYELAILAWGLVALLGGFLAWNWPRAQIFMGDSGSYFLGFLTALYALISYKFFHVPLLLWVIMTSLFWFDATVTLLRRLLAGEQWRKPHKSHAYQRLMQAGWSHQQVLIAAIGVNGVLGVLVWMGHRDPRLLPLALGIAVTMLTCLYIGVEIIKPMFKQWHD